MPILPHIVNGKVYDIHGNILEEVIVTLTHSTISPVLSAITDIEGYKINLSKLSEQWTAGETITLYAVKAGEGRKTIITTISSGGGTTVNLILEETSNINYEPSNMEDRRNLELVMPVLFDGTKITRENPFPVSSSEIDFLNNPSWSWVITRGDGQPDSESIIIRGATYTRTFAYNTNGQMISRSKWVKQ